MAYQFSITDDTGRTWLSGVAEEELTDEMRDRIADTFGDFDALNDLTLESGDGATKTYFNKNHVIAISVHTGQAVTR